MARIEAALAFFSFCTLLKVTEQDTGQVHTEDFTRSFTELSV
jgi:hypothetical protein